jgi:hypothetical protein
MTYGYRPEDWPAFQSELARRGIDSADIEKVELRPEHVVVTLRSGRVESWEQAPPITRSATES